jgi:Flp pilus assembly protein TadD
LAEAYLRVHEVPEAVAALKRAVQLLPNDATAHQALGEALLALHDAQGAQAEFEQRLKLEDSAQAHYDLAEALAMRHISGRAQAEYEKAAQMDPNNPRPLLRLGDLLRSKSDFDGAKRAYNQVLQKFPNNSEAGIRLGILQSRTGDYAGAITVLSKAVQTAKGTPPLDAMVELGFCYYQSGENSKALDTLKRALAIEPGDPLGNYYYGLHPPGDQGLQAGGLGGSERSEPGGCLVLSRRDL